MGVTVNQWRPEVNFQALVLPFTVYVPRMKLGPSDFVMSSSYPLSSLASPQTCFCLVYFLFCFFNHTHVEYAQISFLSVFPKQHGLHSILIVPGIINNLEMVLKHQRRSELPLRAGGALFTYVRSWVL